MFSQKKTYEAMFFKGHLMNIHYHPKIKKPTKFTENTVTKFRRMIHSEFKTFVHVKERELEALDLSLHLKQEI